MAERTNAEAGLIEALPEYRPVKKGEENKGGRPAWLAVTMLKCVMLAKWFGLSDEV